MKFLDSAGMELLNGINVNVSEFNFSKYVSMFAKNPFTFLGIYGRHIINLLDPRFPEIYIHDLIKTRWHLTIISYCILFIIVLNSFIINNNTEKWQNATNRHLLNFKERIRSCFKWFISYGIYFFIILIPSFASIPGGSEPRYFLSVHIVLYIYICFFINYKKLFNHFISKPIMITFIFFIGLAVFCAVIGNTMASAEYGIFLIE
jgi:hypothetical protein